MTLSVLYFCRNTPFSPSHHSILCNEEAERQGDLSAITIDSRMTYCPHQRQRRGERSRSDRVLVGQLCLDAINKSLLLLSFAFLRSVAR